MAKAPKGDPQDAELMKLVASAELKARLLDARARMAEARLRMIQAQNSLRALTAKQKQSTA